MMKKLFLGIAVCCWIGGVNGMELIEETLSPSIKYMSESSSCEVSETPDNSSDDMAEKRTVVADQQWVEKHKELIDLAKTYGVAFDDLIDALTKDKMVHLYDHISDVCWGGVGRFGASHDGTEFYATYECQQYME